MAPTKPHKRSTLRTKARPASTASAPSTTPHRAPQRHTKKAKLHARRTTFQHRIAKAAAPKPPPPSARSRRRRQRAQQQQLVTGLGALADALDDVAATTTAAPRQEGGEGAKRSLASRPGATKRREKVLRGERERFGRNLAIMQAAEGGKGVSTWEALRGFVGATMERKEEFVEREREREEFVEREREREAQKGQGQGGEMVL